VRDAGGLRAGSVAAVAAQDGGDAAPVGASAGRVPSPERANGSGSRPPTLKGSGSAGRADLGLHEWGFSLREHLHDPLFGTFRLRRGLVRSCPPEPRNWLFAVIDKFDLDIGEAGGGAMLGGHDELPVAPAQVEIAAARPGAATTRIYIAAALSPPRSESANILESLLDAIPSSALSA